MVQESEQASRSGSLPGDRLTHSAPWPDTAGRRGRVRPCALQIQVALLLQSTRSSSVPNLCCSSPLFPPIRLLCAKHIPGAVGSQQVYNTRVSRDLSINADCPPPLYHHYHHHHPNPNPPLPLPMGLIPLKCAPPTPPTSRGHLWHNS